MRVMTDEAATILVVEDDDATRTFLADNLTADGYDVLVADCASDALRLLETKFPDVAIVDIGLPDVSGLEILRRVREADGVASRLNPSVPLLVLSGRDTELDRVRAFEAGADDMVGKPFSYAELRLRVAALLRRMESGTRGAGRIRVGDLEIDASSREVLLRGHSIELSQKEFSLLRALATLPTKVWTKEELLRSVWGFRSMGATRTLDSHACRLRQKLAVDGDRFVINVWGVGYRLVDPMPVADPLREPVQRRARFAVPEPGLVA
jgi:DNA-binding response OmpR family regulator